MQRRSPIRKPGSLLLGEKYRIPRKLSRNPIGIIRGSPRIYARGGISNRRGSSSILGKYGRSPNKLAQNDPFQRKPDSKDKYFQWYYINTLRNIIEVLGIERQIPLFPNDNKKEYYHLQPGVPLFYEPNPTLDYKIDINDEKSSYHIPREFFTVTIRFWNNLKYPEFLNDLIDYSYVWGHSYIIIPRYGKGVIRTEEPFYSNRPYLYIHLLTLMAILNKREIFDYMLGYLNIEDSYLGIEQIHYLPQELNWPHPIDQYYRDTVRPLIKGRPSDTYNQFLTIMDYHINLWNRGIETRVRYPTLTKITLNDPEEDACLICQENFAIKGFEYDPVRLCCRGLKHLPGHVEHILHRKCLIRYLMTDDRNRPVNDIRNGRRDCPFCFCQG